MTARPLRGGSPAARSAGAVSPRDPPLRSPSRAGHGRGGGAPHHTWTWRGWRGSCGTGDPAMTGVRASPAGTRA